MSYDPFAEEEKLRKAAYEKARKRAEELYKPNAEEIVTFTDEAGRTITGMKWSEAEIADRNGIDLLATDEELKEQGKL